jgi:hypothetical protein
LSYLENYILIEIVKYILFNSKVMVRVIPGVEVKVVKEIVPQQLYPSGVVGIIGTADRGEIGIAKPFGSYKELTEVFGNTGTLAKEARQAFLNGVFQVFATRVGSPSGAGDPATAFLQGPRKRNIVKLTARNPGDDGNNIKLVVMRGEEENTVRIELSDGRTNETFTNLTMDPSKPLFLINTLNESSKLVKAESLLSEPSADNNPVFGEIKFEGGKNAPQAQPSLDDYEKALESLELEPNIDVVYVADTWDEKVHALVDAHCKNMSIGGDTKPLGPRIGIGTVGPGETYNQIIERTRNIASDRFMLVAPYGFAGAVAGLVSKLNYFESPTFKPLTGVVWPEQLKRYTPSEQMQLISNGILTIDAVRGRGLIVLKGITTSKEQISVQRVADHSVRGIKNIADNFIGTLNNARGRMALRERITEFLIGMEKEGSIVPSTDGTQPAYLVDVYSSQADFAQGIVRTDVAVRPVRAMDYIYATINVQS